MNQSYFNIYRLFSPSPPPTQPTQTLECFVWNFFFFELTIQFIYKYVCGEWMKEKKKKFIDPKQLQNQERQIPFVKHKEYSGRLDWLNSWIRYLSPDTKLL